MVAENPEISDFHEAFEVYCMQKYSLGSSAISMKTGGKGDLGIDFFSTRERAYHVAQCKTPAKDWLEANPGKIRLFTPAVLRDPQDALRYLVGDSSLIPNDRVRHLYALVEADRGQEDFSLVFLLIVFGRLDGRARDGFAELKRDYEKKGVQILLRELDDLVDEYLVGASHGSGEINLDLRFDPDMGLLRAHDYCYFLANAADIFDAFKDYGWRLFDLNLRYEVRNSPINGDIVRSLEHAKTRKRFHHYNNGLIVVTRSYAFREKQHTIRLTGPQIVNGLQSVKSIYNAVADKAVTRDQLDADCLVQVKLITTGDADFVANIVRSTNNQNPMSPRNLRANSKEQKLLRKGFAALVPKWFLQVKEGEWDSLTDEGGRFFKQVVGHNPIDFRPPDSRRRGRVVDNQDAAKAWLAFSGFADLAGDRVTHYFENPAVYQLAFTMSPGREYWDRFAEALDFDAGRHEALKSEQGDANQYLLAVLLWKFTRNFIPSAQRYREEALNEGVRAGKIAKASGSFTSPQSMQEAFLSDNLTYQTWRLMANMKELIVEVVSHLLAKRYGALDAEKCEGILKAFDLRDAAVTGETRELALGALAATDPSAEAIFARIFGLIRYSAGQYWEDKRKELMSTSRIRTVLLRREVAAAFKRQVQEIGERRGLERSWKPGGRTFLESLPDLP